jgi:hypothetical protein
MKKQPTVKEKQYALACSHAYLSCFGGLDKNSMPPEEWEQRQRDYREACRAAADHYGIKKAVADAKG